MGMHKTERKYKIGDKVIYINGYGVNWGIKTIIGVEDITWGNGNGYYIDPTDTPWFAVQEENLHSIKQEETQCLN